MRIHFVLVGEGTSDDGLIPHLENLCVYQGADEVTGTSVDFQRLKEPGEHTIEAKLRAAIKLEPEANLFFLHRDADRRDSQPRREEIARAVSATGLEQEWVPVIPVQETEAWILLDEAAIRLVAGKPKGREPLSLPSPAHVESVASPKEKLKAALIAASETKGRRLAKFRNDFPDHRRLLLQRLPVEGPLLYVDSWLRLRDDLDAALARLHAKGVAATPAKSP